MTIYKIKPLPPPEEQSEFLKKLVKLAEEMKDSPERKALIRQKEAYEAERARLIEQAREGGVTAKML